VSDAELVIGGCLLRNCIATGNTSQVWEVTQQATSRQLAMKLLLPESHRSFSHKQSLKHEFKVGNSMEHPVFLTYHKVEVDRDYGFFLMDYFRGTNLKVMMASDRVKIHARLNKLIEQLCLGLAAMHDKGWLHRDIKPDNILLNKGSEVRLIDFSLSSRQSSAVTRMFAGKSKSIQGTRTYIAPETIRKQRPTIQTDIYSLGVTLYQVLAGNPPFAGKSPSDVLRKHLQERPYSLTATDPNITPELEQFVFRMLAKNPKDRHASANEMYAEFRSLKPFKEDVHEIAERERKELEEKKNRAVDSHLDSRADAERTAAGITAPVRPRKNPKPAPEPKETPVAPVSDQPAQTPVAPATAQPQMPPGWQPGMPYPGMPAAQPVPGYQPVMPGVPGMPAPPPQYPTPGQPYPQNLGQISGMPPQMPGQPMPGQPVPGQPVAPPAAPQQPQMPSQPVPGQGPAPQTAVPPASPEQPATAQPTQQPEDPDAPVLDDFDIV